jgi:hypothetical protein
MSNIVRSTLLPPYLEDSPAWAELTDSIDAVFGPRIDDPTVWLSRLRDTWILQPSVEESLAETSQIIASTDFETVEKNILIRQANMLGFDLDNSDILTSEDYQRIVRNIANYWYSKGTPHLQNFLGFVLDSIITITNLWSVQGPSYDKYGTFLPEGDPGIGTPVWEPGGTWFPTTHVQLTSDPFRFATFSVEKITDLFYSIANYNLVLRDLILDGRLYLHSVDETLIGRILVIAPMCDIEETITTF